MKKIRLKLQERSYDITIGQGAIKGLPGIIKSMGFNGPIALITDSKVNLKTKKTVDPVLGKIPNDIHKIIVPASERSKSLKVFEDTVLKISKVTRKHKPMIIAMGGGVVGDLAGFVAATYRRGVPLIQLPTTLLAQVDSSVGGKVGVDIPEAKNLIGAFCQPKAVVMDTKILKTLPVKQIRNGIAEIIKYAIIGNRSFFDLLEKDMENILALKGSVMDKVVATCAASKARVVEKDEFDVKDIRIILNFGHTLGHAVEAASEYSDVYNHGESVALGMVMASDMAVRLDMMKVNEFDRIKALIRRAGLPLRVRGLSTKNILNSFKYDKKFIKGTNRFVLPKRIGAVEVIDDIPGLLVRTVLRKYVD